MTYFFDKTLTIRRERVISGDRTAYSATGTAWPLSLQPVGDERSEMGGTAGKTYNAYVDVSCEATEGDYIVVDTKRYYVKAESVYDFGGIEHKRLLVIQKTSQV